jgi:tripartite-type tricarboxylate transporter receptor subunit TctC
MTGAARISRRTAFAAAAGLVAAPRPGLSQAWPSRPFRIIAPFQPGGIVDNLARLLSDRMQRSLEQPLVVENRPGAGGNIGTALVARAKGDPYMLLVGSSGPLAVSPTTEKNLGYDPLTDLTPITILAATPLVMVVPASSPHRTLQDLIATMRRDGKEALFPTPGVGSPQLLAGQAFCQRIGVTPSAVHYTGSAPVVMSIIANEMPWAIENLVLVLPHIRAGKLRAIAVTSRERAAMLPEVPTFVETGVPGFEATGWYGLLAPAGIPAEVVDRIHAAAVEALRDPETAQRIAEMGSPNITSTPGEFKDMIGREIRKWRSVLLASNTGPQ